MGFIPHTDDEREQMLAGIGAETLSDLFADIPEPLRDPDLGLPEPQSAQRVERLLHELGRHNIEPAPQRSFIGAGTYHHYIPPIVADVLSRPSLYSAYTPYQPELSQGTLQAGFEYQGLVCALTGMPVSNASHYDGATALAEGVLMALGAADNEASRVLISGNVNPLYRRVVQTYLQGMSVSLISHDKDMATRKPIESAIDQHTAALVVQSPGFLGEMTDPATMTELANAIHSVGGLLIVVADPIAMGMLVPPGDCGADVVVADGQPLGLPPAYGGPRVGIFAVRDENVRRLAGRLIGQTRDAEGRRGYVLTLATREQHIRRARATSNICTNAALGALAATVYLAALGPAGLREVAELCFHKSHYLADQLRTRLGLTVNPHKPQDDRQPWFREFVVELPLPVSQVNAFLLAHEDIVGGLDLSSQLAPAEHWQRRALIAVSEVHTKSDLDAFVSALGEAIKSDTTSGGEDETKQA